MAPAARQAIGIAAGGLLSVAMLMSPLTPAAVGAVAGLAGPAASSRMLHYHLDVDYLRDPDAYARASAGLPESASNLLLLGSSELSSPVAQNPVRFLPAKVSDFDLFLSGRGYTQSLHQATMLAAMGPQLRNRKVALIVSPQWFTPDGVSVQAFDEVSSAEALRRVASSPDLPDDLRQRLLDRVSQVRGLAELPGVVSAGLSQALTGRVQAGKAQVAAARFTGDYAVAERAVPVASIDWEAELREAEEQGRAASSNDLQIEDEYYARYIAPRLAELKDSMSGTDYSGPSPEYGDLGLFLDVAHALGIEVLLISTPMHGAWHDYAGYPAERRASYYERIRALASRPGVRVADFSGHEYEPYFLVDVMHLGWKGWLHVTRACADFAAA
ncbi:MAG: D-alanyl-lipoteichoic acid biosynthesis protein DltD [Propionibacteriaceae bacterium]|nr:D-alanyl-lipoteichoic acid biosynthesis protein DltD [Propionibacteriaceae bacterium]